MGWLVKRGMENIMRHQHTATSEKGKDLTPVEARQGGGPRDMFTVLVVSLLLASATGMALLYYFLS
jgi:hypothetical protein